MTGPAPERAHPDDRRPSVGPGVPEARADRRPVAVAGASGYVGQLLTARLADDGHLVRALARHADRLPQHAGVEARSLDVADVEATTTALAGVDIAYYLVHAMAGGAEFAAKDRGSARSFAAAARRARVGRIVYLGALGEDAAASDHLFSRHEVGDLLRESGIPVVELRAAVVLGAGSISFEMLRHLTERLPAMVCPRWVDTRLQPLAERDLVACLLKARHAPPGIYELGTPDVTTYREMMHAYGRARGLPRRRIITVPLLTPALSAHWVDLVTPVDRAVSHALVESLRHDVVVRRAGASAGAFGDGMLGVDEAIEAALVEQADAMPAGFFDRREGLRDGVYTMCAAVRVDGRQAEVVRRDLLRAGGTLDWYGVRPAWRLRLLLGRALGEQLALERPDHLAPGSRVDWWRVAALDADSLVLASRSWRFGDAWLGFRVRPAAGRPEWSEVLQVAAFRPKGVAGLAYWRLLWPVHRIVLRAMVRHRRRRVEGGSPLRRGPHATTEHSGDVAGTTRS